jgi:hypothetical protein
MEKEPPTTHLRLPQRSDAVAGETKQPGRPLPIAVTLDPRTSSQDPAFNARGILSRGAKA